MLDLPNANTLFHKMVTHSFLFSGHASSCRISLMSRRRVRRCRALSKHGPWHHATAQVRVLSCRRDNRPPSFQSRPSPAFHGNPSNPREETRGKSITVDPESALFPEAGWNEDTEAFGHVMDYVTKEVRRRIAFTTWVSQETPTKADYLC